MRTSLVGRRRLGLVQSECPCVQVLHNMAPGYVSALCQPVSSIPGRRHLRSTGRGELDFPVSICPRMGRAFAYAGRRSHILEFAA